jgi:hypothetical protein
MHGQLLADLLWVALGVVAEGFQASLQVQSDCHFQGTPVPQFAAPFSSGLQATAVLL